MRGRGGGHVPKGIEERHEEQTDRDRRTSIRVARRFPIDVNSSGGRSDQLQPLVAIFLFKLSLEPKEKKLCLELEKKRKERKEKKRNVLFNILFTKFCYYSVLDKIWGRFR